MPQNLAFLFTKITPEQMMYMWNVLTASGKGGEDVFFERLCGMFVFKVRTNIGNPKIIGFRFNFSRSVEAIFVAQVLMIIAYCGALAMFPEHWWTCTLFFGVPFSYIAIQHLA